MEFLSKPYVVVVGGAGGIGSAVVARFVTAGHQIIVIDIDELSGKALEEKLKPSVQYFTADVTSDDSIQRLVNQLQQKKVTIQHVIECAGIGLSGEWQGIRHTPFGVISDSIDLNLKSHIRVTQALLPLFQPMASANRSIAYISSINAILDGGGPGYSAAKAGLLGLVRACTSELGREGIRVNAVLPGTVPTPNTIIRRYDLDAMLAKTALGRLTTPLEVAEVIYALAENLTCITGQFIIADCGQSARL